jgi:ribosomal-protein-alanine N-acetyltransferase
MTLSTGRLLLRPFRAADHAAVHAYASDPEVVRFMDYGPNTEAETAGFLAMAMAPRAGHWPLAIVRHSDEAVLGAVDLHVESEQHRRGEMGYVLARAAWGHGYATEAAAALLEFGLTEAGLHRVSATCDPANAASARVLDKIGMRREGHLHDHFRVRGEWRDRLLYARVAAPSQ